MPKYTTSVIPARETADKVRESFLDWLAAEDNDRQARYRAYREYYDGQHDTQLTERQRKYLQVKIGEEFNANFCPIVVNALAERLTVTGFDAEDGELLWEWWDTSRMDAVQGIVHTAAVRDGDTYLIVEWDNERDRPCFISELAYDGAEGVKVHYSPEKRGVIDFASKRWRVNQGPDSGYQRRMNLYYPDRIEKYVSDQRLFEGAWQPYHKEGELWPIPWLASDGAPLGVPVVHFKNGDEGYNYGQSEIRDIIPIQNALNKTTIDLLATADTTAFRIYYMIGDDPSSLTLTPGSWVYSKRPPGGDNGAAIGAIDPADLRPLLDLKDAFTIQIAQISRTPISYFQASGQRPAEGTLKQEESGLVAKARNRQVTFGNSWEDAMNIARRLAATYGEGAADDDEPISAQWRDPETRNEKEHLEALGIKRTQLGVPLEQLWLEAGYTPEQIENMRDSDEHQARVGLMRLGFGGEGQGG